MAALENKHTLYQMAQKIIVGKTAEEIDNGLVSGNNPKAITWKQLAKGATTPAHTGSHYI